MVQIISLNIGGRKFQSTEKTLAKSQYFNSILKTQSDKSLEIFVDRSGMIFEHVIAFLTKTTYPFPKEHLDELDFYGIEYPTIDSSKQVIPTGNTKVIEKDIYIVAASLNAASIDIYNMEGEIVRKLIPAKGTFIRTFCVSPNLNLIASGGSNITIWSVIDGSIWHNFNDHTKDIIAIAFSFDNKLVASGCMAGKINIWDVTKGLKVLSAEAHIDWVRSLAFSHDNKKLVSGSDDGSMSVWDLERGGLLTTLKSHKSFVMNLAFSADDKTIISSGLDGTIKSFSGDFFQETSNTVDMGNNPMVFSNNTKIVALISKNVRLSNTQNFETINTINMNKSIITIGFSMDDKLIVVGDSDQNITIYKTNGELLKTFQTAYRSQKLALLSL